MVYDKVSKAILRKLLYDTRIGGRHISEEDIQHGFPKHERGNVKDQLKKLVKDNLILKHPTSYGPQYALNPAKLAEIEKIIEEE